MDLPDFKQFIKDFEDLRYVCGADGRKKKKKKKNADEVEEKRRYNAPPDKPTTDLDEHYKDNTDCKSWMVDGLSLHPYQLEGKVNIHNNANIQQYDIFFRHIVTRTFCLIIFRYILGQT